MKPVERLRSIVEALPDGASVSLSVEDIRGWLAEDTPFRPSPTPRAEDKMLTAADVAEVLAVDKSWVYRHAAQLPFTRHISEQTLRFSSKGLQKWIASRR